MKKRNKIAVDLFTKKYRKRVVKPKKGNRRSSTNKRSAGLWGCIGDFSGGPPCNTCHRAEVCSEGLVILWGISEKMHFVASRKCPSFKPEALSIHQLAAQTEQGVSRASKRSAS